MEHQVDQVIAQWVTSDPRARIVVDADLRPVWASASANTLMNQPDAMLRRNGRISASSRRTDDDLRRLVSEAGRDTTTQCLSDSGAGRHLVLAATRIEGPWEHLVGISIQNADEDHEVRLADLRQVFGLTPAEALVAHHLLCGKTAEEVAADLGVRLETVRTHIKRTYAKMGVGSREAFFYKLAPFAVSFD